MSQHLPGVETGRTMTPREIMLTREAMIQVPIVVDGNLGIDGGNTNSTDEIRAGWFMGRITASGRWTPCKRTLADGAGTSATALVVDNPGAFKAADSIKIGSGSAVTISALNYSTRTLTLAAARTWSDNDVVIAQDGSETARGLLLDFVKLRNGDNTAAAHKSAGLLIQGVLTVSMLLGDAAAIRADTSPATVTRRPMTCAHPFPRRRVFIPRESAVE